MMSVFRKPTLWLNTKLSASIIQFLPGLSTCLSSFCLKWESFPYKFTRRGQEGPMSNVQKIFRGHDALGNVSIISTLRKV